MSKVSTAIKLLTNERRQFMVNCIRDFGGWLPDKLYLKLLYRFSMGQRLNLKNPKTFNEKIQWLKLYNRKPEYTMMVDKYAVKEYVAQKIGKEYIIPTFGVWETPKQIEWDKLPDQFVLKTTHGGGSGGVVICKDKRTFDYEGAIHKLSASLKSDIYRSYREWPYKDVPKQIIAEKFMAPMKSVAPKDLPDYKFFCFNGEPLFCQVIRDRHAKETIDFYDMDWNHQEFVGLNPIAHNGQTPVACPKHLDSMKEICRKLAENIPFVRVDLYVIDDKEYFGELTFYPASGIGVFTPDEWKYKLGDLLKLPERRTLSGGVKCLVYKDEILIINVSPSYDELKDYKFFCFNGKVKFFKVDFGRFVEHHANYFSPDGDLLPFGEQCCTPDHNHKERLPENLKDMITLAERLSKGVPFLRVDLYPCRRDDLFWRTNFFPGWRDGKVDFCRR